MADPGTAIGLAASIITFVHFGVKFVAGTRRIRDSVNGTGEEITSLNHILEDVRNWNNKIRSQNSTSHTRSEDAKRLIAMVAECERVYIKLRKLLDKLVVREEASRTLESARVAYQTLRKSSEIRELHSQLLELDDRIRSNLQYALQEKRHGSIMSQLKATESSYRAMGIENDSKLDSIKEDMLRLTQVKSKHFNTQAAQLESLRTKIDVLQKNHLVTKVLKSLYFVEVRRRFDQIPLADQRSNRWVFDPDQTTFGSWLEDEGNGNCLFYVFGKAGSGKSTLMKCIFEAEESQRRLQRWAGMRQLYTGSFYFWNQGSEMQKSGLGLFQSLLYQILKSAPELIPRIFQDRPHYETWDRNTLEKTFKQIAEQTKLDAKFCFFIDGLDEYNGDMSDIIAIFRTLSAASHIKICASSRPDRIYERFLRRKDWSFDIARFTRNDMEAYVHSQLYSSEKFRRLAYSEPPVSTMHSVYAGLIADISDWAQGVWLWVFLVTRDIIREAEQDEDIATFRKIVDNFPSDLQKYFEQIVEGIRDVHKPEMAETFLVAVDELQPLPLYAFSLLEKERTEPDYAVQARIEPISIKDISSKYPVWQSRVRNRCGDLFDIDDKPHPVFLSHSVDFLHRTVRDFLRDCYHQQLKTYVRSNFNPLLSLCKIHLCFLKGLTITDFRNKETVNKLIGLTDELLYYAHEIEKRTTTNSESPTTAILDELNRVNNHHARKVPNHWTHARDSPSAQGNDHYIEGGHCNFLALAVQTRLVSYVRTKLQQQPSTLQKRGRPLLDYATRPRRVTPISMPYHSIRDDPSIDLDMIKLLLDSGADPNQRVYLNDGESVWGLFLISMYMMRGDESDSLREAWFNACIALIRAGAKPDYAFVHKQWSGMRTVSSVFETIFGFERAAVLQEEIDTYKRATSSKGLWWLPWWGS